MEASEWVSNQSGELSLNGYKKMLLKYSMLKIMKNQIYISFICVYGFFFLLICITYLGIGHEENVDIEQIPSPVSKGYFKPIPRSPQDSIAYITFDLETTDLSKLIKQIVMKEL